MKNTIQTCSKLDLAQPLGSTTLAIKVFFLLMLLASANPAQTTSLRISTYPSNAEVFANTAPQRGQLPLGLSPHTIPLADSLQNITIYLFKLDMRDTALDIRLHSGRNNFVVVRMRPQLDSLALQAQQDFLSRRAWKKRGQNVLLASLLPLALGSYYTVTMARHYHRAEQYQQKLESSVIVQGPLWDSNQQGFQRERNSGDTEQSKAMSFGAVALGMAAVGLVLQF